MVLGNRYSFFFFFFLFFPAKIQKDLNNINLPARYTWVRDGGGDCGKILTYPSFHSGDSYDFSNYMGYKERTTFSLGRLLSFLLCHHFRLITCFTASFISL